MKIRPRAFAGIALAAATVLGLSACGGDPDPVATSDQEISRSLSGEITVYSAERIGPAQEWVDTFTAATGVEVNLQQGSELELANQIVQEGASSPADVFLSQNSPAMAQVERAGLLAGLRPATLKQVPSQFQPTSGRWTGIAARATVLLYNKDKVSGAAVPASVTDLANPEWKGKWAAVPSSPDFQAIVAAVLQLKGEESTKKWLTGVAANMVTYPSNLAAMQAADKGEVDAALMFHYDYYSDQGKTGASSKNLIPHYFQNQDPGAFVSVSAGGVLAASKNSEAAEAFVKFVTGGQAQSVLKDGASYEYAIGSEVPANDQLAPLEDLQSPTIDLSALDAPNVTALMSAAGLL